MYQQVPDSALPPPSTEPCVCQSQLDVGPMFAAQQHATHWRPDRTCSYCGSIDPEYLIQRLAEGTVTLEATGKAYKRYVRAAGAPLHQHYKQDGEWVTRTTTQVKLYMWHVTADQLERMRAARAAAAHGGGQ